MSRYTKLVDAGVGGNWVPYPFRIWIIDRYSDVYLTADCSGAEDDFEALQ